MALEVYPPVEVIVNLSACVAGKHFEWKKKQSCLYFNSKLAHTFLMGVSIKNLVSEPVFALVESIAIDTCTNKILPGGLIITKYIL